MNVAAHKERIASLGCVLCRKVLGMTYSHAEVHHIGDSSERSDWLTIPLCTEHHRGATGFHGLGERAFNRTYKTCEIVLLGFTIQDLANAGR
jgi:hypothetical protein